MDTIIIQALVYLFFLSLFLWAVSAFTELRVWRDLKNIYSTQAPLIHLVIYSVSISALPVILTSLFEKLDKFFYGNMELFARIANIIASVLAIFTIGLVYYFRKKITLIRIIASIICLFLLASTLTINDYYLGRPFLIPKSYWHIFAYFFLALLVNRALRNKKIHVAGRIRLTYFLALALAIFNEVFSVIMTKGRIFDLNDIAKSGFGVLTGLIFIYFVIQNGKSFFPWKKNAKFHHVKIRDYFKHPISFLVLMVIFNFIFMIFSSLLTAFRYIPLCLILTVITSAFFLFIYTSLRQRKIRKIFVITITILLVLQLASCIVYRKHHITYNTYGLTIYKGVLFPLFDVMIFPDDNFRFTDKKHYFSPWDVKTILNQKPDIVIFGTGSFGFGGKGEGIEELKKNKDIVLILRKTPEAVKIFNEIKRSEKNKRVLFLLHNTC